MTTTPKIRISGTCEHDGPCNIKVRATDEATAAVDDPGQITAAVDEVWRNLDAKRSAGVDVELPEARRKRGAPSKDQAALFANLFPERTVTDSERSWLTHMIRFGLDGYPIKKRGSQWWFVEFMGVSGRPSPFATKRDAVAAVERFIEVLSHAITRETLVRASARAGDDEVDVYVPKIAGPLAWAQLHSWAQNIHDFMCPNCGAWAIKAARALHDVVNAKLGKPIRYPKDLEAIAGAFDMANRSVNAAARQPAGHLHTDAKLIDFTTDLPGVLEWIKAPAKYDMNSLEPEIDNGDHGVLNACPLDGGKCGVVAVVHPRREEHKLIDEAIRKTVRLAGDGAVQVQNSNLLAFLRSEVA